MKDNARDGWCHRALVGLFAIACLVGGELAAQSVQENPSLEIRAVVGNTIIENRMPGMIAAIADANGLMAIGAAGFRKAGDTTVLTTNDLVHIGSCAKAMTSTMLATLVAEGALRWESKLIEIIPELKGAIHPEYNDVTLWELVSHRAQFPENAPSWWDHLDLDLKERRVALVKDSLKDSPTIDPGRYFYSNLGYVAAGCMAEAVTGMTWEELMQARIFGPLEMTTAGFGPPGTPDTVDQPWGHAKRDGGWEPTQIDNPEALGPAGRVHCSIADWAKFASLQLQTGDTAILSRRHLDTLIQNTGDYAAGWVVADRVWAEGKALAHSGSNTMWFSTIWIAPKINRAFFVATNSSDADSARICDELVGKLIAINRDFVVGL